MPPSTLLRNIYKSGYAKQRCIVLIPSIILGPYSQQFLHGLRYYEERYLYFLAYLKNPNTRLVAVLTEGVEPALLDYFYDHIKKAVGITAQDIRERFQIIWVKAVKGKTLTQNILHNKKLIQKIRDAVPNKKDASIEFWRVTNDELSLAKKLAIPYYGLNKSAFSVNTKSGARQLFQQCRISIPKGYHCVSLPDVHRKLQKLLTVSPAKSFLVKLNDEGGGVGIIRLAREACQQSYTVFVKQFPLPKEESLSLFQQYFKKEGGVVEEFIEPHVIASPSVQFEIFPDGSIQDLSTHDQIIDGVDYLGTRFPANEDYRKQIIAAGRTVTKEIKKMGGQGFIAMDLLVTKENEKHKIWGIEINARKGGANHTNMWAVLLTGARYNIKRGILESDKGDVYYRASEYFINQPWLKKISPRQLLNVIHKEGLDFNAKTKEGVFVHLLSPLPHFGKFGVTVIAHSQDDVERYWKRLEDTIKIIPR